MSAEHSREILLALMKDFEKKLYGNEALSPYVVAVGISDGKFNVLTNEKLDEDFLSEAGAPKEFQSIAVDYSYTGKAYFQMN